MSKTKDGVHIRPLSHISLTSKMELTDLLLPLRRRWIWALLGGILLTGLFFAATNQLTKADKTTIYFTVKASGEAPAGNHYYSAEGAERMADAISGWVKDPSFRTKVIEKATAAYGKTVKIDDLKQKLSARKQNRSNVFYTLNLAENERQFSPAMSDGIVGAVQEHLAQINADSPFPFTITPPERFTEWQTLPWVYILIGALLLGFGISVVGVYLFEGLTGRIMHISQVEKALPNVPILRPNSHVSEHDSDILEPFLMQLGSHKMIGMFDQAEHYFSVNKLSDVVKGEDTAVLLMRLGETRLSELQNVASVIPNKRAVVLFTT